MSKLNDQSLEKLLSTISHYVMDSLDEIVAFDVKSNEAREEIIKVALKSLEVSSILTCKFFDTNTLDLEQLDKVDIAIKENDFEKANLILSEEK